MRRDTHAATPHRRTEPRDADRLVSTAEAAAYLGISAQHMRAMRSAGTGPEYHRYCAVGTRGRAYYRLSAIESWLAARRHHSTADEEALAAPAPPSNNYPED
ncbi:MAG: helix-turn-helix domain-containing protein [Acidobacteria bacterium]|nr:helix-turn-helix domain-containing protein [Acidobacteriota bacterium]